MAKLVYSAMASLDGFIADEAGRFDWAAPDEEVFRFINNLELRIGTFLFGRRMYEVMAVWETLDASPGLSSSEMEFAKIWRAADKIVYSRTLTTVPTARTRLVRDFDPEAVRAMKARGERDLAIGGPELAAHAIRAGLVDEWLLFIAPVVVGGGKPAFPGKANVNLDLIEERRFGNGMVYLRYLTSAREG